MQAKIAITGANGGIGGAIALTMAGTGATLALMDIATAPNDQIAPLLVTGRAHYYQTDVSRPDSVHAATRSAAIDMRGISQIITCAGVTSFGNSQSITAEEWNRVIAINLTGVFLCCQAAIPEIVKHGALGRIINIGSVLAKNGGNARPWLDPSEQERSSNVAYGAAKAGVHAMTKFLAKELASCGATANCVAPGPIASAMTARFPDALKQTIPLGRMGTANEVAAVVRFLSSPEASFVSGEIIDVNGAMWCD